MAATEQAGDCNRDANRGPCRGKEQGGAPQGRRNARMNLRSVNLPSGRRSSMPIISTHGLAYNSSAYTSQYNSPAG
eukprot:15440205-Alexandrium_andersonii.AAC.1